jgi:hypothetical protein
MGQQGVWHYLAISAHGVERAAEINGVPQRYGSCDQGEPAGAVLLRFDGLVAQLAEAMKADSTRKGIPAVDASRTSTRSLSSPRIFHSGGNKRPRALVEHLKEAANSGRTMPV